MRHLRNITFSTGRWALRPGVWGTVLILIVTVAAGLGLGRLILAPALFASSGTITEGTPARPSLSPRTSTAAPSKRHAAVAVTHEPQVEIALIKVEQPKRKRRRHRSKPAPDVVYHAPKDVESFAAPSPAPMPEEGGSPDEGGSSKGDGERDTPTPDDMS